MIDNSNVDLIAQLIMNTTIPRLYMYSMLQKCEQFTDSYRLKFNASKTQLVRFGHAPVGCWHKFILCGRILPVVASAVHLDHILHAGPG